MISCLILVFKIQSKYSDNDNFFNVVGRFEESQESWKFLNCFQEKKLFTFEIKSKSLNGQGFIMTLKLIYLSST